MAGYLTYSLLSLSLVIVVHSNPSIHKRPFFTEEDPKQKSMMDNSFWTFPDTTEHTKDDDFASLDFDSILNDPLLMSLGETHVFDTAPLDFPHKEDPFFSGKHELSNVIPGAQGPFFNVPARNQNDLADDMMDEFSEFLRLKENGMLDKCLGRHHPRLLFKKKRNM